MNRRAFLAGTAGALAATAVNACRSGDTRYGSPWDDVLARMPRELTALVGRPEHEVQAIYTRIERNDRQEVSLSTATLGRVPRRWFTAASWVKFPAVLLAAERFTALGLDATARVVLSSPPASGDWDDAEPLDETFERTIRRLFTVSENVPFNRLYEYLGQDEIGAGLAAHGYPDARVIARLGSGDVERNRRVGDTRILAGNGDEIERRSSRQNPVSPSFPFGQVLKGSGWQSADGTVVPGPHDFSRTNFIPLDSMHGMLTALIFPEAMPDHARWKISPELRRTVLTELARWPRESADPVYPAPEHFDGFAKYFVVGDTRTDAAPSVRQFSKCGQAYGYLQDCAYIVDRDAGVEFLLTATIYANADGIFNDDVYEYDAVSAPFLAALGRGVLEFEREQVRPVRPDFSDLPERW